jgi:hypothetical protein
MEVAIMSSDTPAGGATPSEPEKQDAKAAKKKGFGVNFKVSQKGAVSVYGLGRFPVTLYREQWVRLLERADDLRAFMEEHAGELKSKGEEGEKPAEPATEPATTIEDAGASYPPSNE